MSDLETVEFKLKLSSEWFRLPPHVKVYLNDDLIEDTEISERKSESQNRTISFSRQLPDGMHKLRIEYTGKELPDTKIDSDGQIIADHLVNIDEIEIDEIDLGFLSFRKGQFKPDLSLRPDLPEMMGEMTCIGYNGVWELEIEVPTYIWFLENL